MADSLARDGFDIDLRYGQQREDAFARVLRGALVEVKSDQKVRCTGSLFIEFEQRGRPSGIAVTTADYWAFEILTDRWLLIRTAELKDAARRTFRRRGAILGGDYNRYRGVLVPLSQVLHPTMGTGEIVSASADEIAIFGEVTR